ncbi:GTPase Era [Pelagibacteraceae bacterium]|jgi:GTP-binding protein Era|nr:GTPase Era [Pelagibacteraceae bacterium]MDC0954242.1 GTPase Era [Pelagibacteraceae bacterium]
MIKKSGFVAISGPTNSGKSTLLNSIFEKKVSIVSHKVQTTLKSLDAVKNYGDTQIVFIDTPGYYQKKNDANFIKDVLSGIERSDLLLIILDITSRFEYLEQIEKIVKNYKKKKFLIINKIDLVNNEYVLEKLSTISFIKNFDEVFYLSALKNKNIKKLLDHVSKSLPTQEWIYKKNNSTNISKESFLAEITREGILKYLNQEIPYQVSIETEKLVKSQNYTIHQKIIVSTISHKKIILGKNGSSIKSIGVYARIEMEKVLKAKCNLFLKVVLKKR